MHRCCRGQRGTDSRIVKSSQKTPKELFAQGKRRRKFIAKISTTYKDPEEEVDDLIRNQ